MSKASELLDPQLYGPAEFLTVKGVEELSSEFSDYGSVDGFMAIMIALLFFGTTYALEAIGSGIWFRPWVRGILADYAYPVS